MTGGSDGESAQTRSRGGRFAVLATAAGLLLLVGGFFIGRVSEGESSDATTTTEAEDKPPGGGGAQVLTRACGKGAGPDAEDVVKVFPPIIVTDADIEAEPEGSPERAFLEWWQAYQFSDLVAVEALTSPSTIDAIGDDKLAALVNLPGPGLPGVEVLGASENGDTASVNAGLLSFEPSEPGGPVPNEPTNSTPESFAMEAHGGDWLFAGTEYLALRLNSLPG